MPQLVKKIIHYRDYGKNYHRLEFNSDIPRNVKYVAGDSDSLIPSGMVLNTSIQQSTDQPLFNKANNGIITENITSPTIVYLECRKGKSIKDLYLSSENIVYDLFYGNEDLIYKFFIDSQSAMLSLKIKIESDKNGIYQKLKANSDDLYFRLHFIEKALETSKLTFSERDIESYPEYMTIEQVASFFGRSTKTIHHWRIAGDISYVTRGNKKWYRKSVIEREMKHVKKQK